MEEEFTSDQRVALYRVWIEPQCHMQHFVFVPQTCPSRKRVKDYTGELGDNSLRQATYELEEVFLGRRGALCKQASWMGRGCFFKPTGQHYLVVKGIGPSPGSEQMRQMLDQIMCERGDGLGGCLRLQTKTFFPLLVQFANRNNCWHVIDPRPEGLSIFGFLYREAEAAAVLQQLNLRAVFPLLLLRNKLVSPWQANNRASFEEYVTKRLPAAIEKHLNVSVEELRLPLNFASLVYMDMDGGVLIRRALSPYRIANLHQTVVDNDREGLEFLTSHMREIFCSGQLCERSQLSLRFTNELAGIASRLFHEGIIHGQLNVHHQNITLAAEIADFDELTFVRSKPNMLDGIPFPDSPCLALYAGFGKRLKSLERRLKTDMTTVLWDDYQEFVGISYEGVDRPRLAAFLLRQVYDLYVQSHITADLLYRNVVSDLQQPGTVLDLTQSRELQQLFIEKFLSDLMTHNSLPLLDWCMAEGLDYLFVRLLDRRQRRTFYGWSQPDVRVGRLIDICGSSRAQHIIEEAKIFFAGLIEARRSISTCRVPAGIN